MLGLDLGLDARSRLDARRSIFWSRLDARRSIFDGFGNARGYPSQGAAGQRLGPGLRIVAHSAALNGPSRPEHRI